MQQDSRAQNTGRFEGTESMEDSRRFEGYAGNGRAFPAIMEIYVFLEARSYWDSAIAGSSLSGYGFFRHNLSFFLFAASSLRPPCPSFPSPVILEEKPRFVFVFVFVFSP
jgi:hypothetical protein